MNGLNIIKNISLLEFGQHRVDGPTVPIKIEDYYKKKKNFQTFPTKTFALKFFFILFLFHKKNFFFAEIGAEKS